MRQTNNDRCAESVKTKWIRLIVIVLCVLSFMLTFQSCGAKKNTVSSEQPAVVEPGWHTCLIQGARATATLNDDRLSASVTMQTVRDSMIVISVMPMFGVEMVRIEATPLEFIGIDKIHGRYAKATFADINRKLTPSLNWDILQQICSGELPTGADKARLLYVFGNQTIELTIDYTPRRLDVPVKVSHQRLDKYTRVDLSKWL